mgnify:CR=1 FL=1
MPNPEMPLPEPATKAAELQRAFDVFNQVSAELTQAYGALQGQVASLTEQLAVANGALRRLEEITPAGMVAQIDLTITDDFPLAQAIVIISAD